MKNNSDKIWKQWCLYFAAAFFAGGCFLTGAFFWYHDSIYDQILQKDMEQIDETSNYIANGVYEELMQGIHVLENINEGLELKGKASPEETQNFLNEVGANEKFDKIGLAYFDEFSPGDTCDRIDNEAFGEIIRNQEYYISNIQIDGEEINEREIIMAVPFYQGEQLVGAVWGRYPVAELARGVNIDNTTYRYFHIIDTNGNYITHSSNQYVLSQDCSLWDELDQYDLYGNTTVEEIRSNMDHCKSGNFWFEVDGKARYVNYAPLGINHWYIFSVLAEEELSGYVQSIERASAVLMACLGVFMVFVIAVIVAAARLVYLNIREKNRELEMKNRIFSVIQMNIKALVFIYDKGKNTFIIYHNDEEHQEEEIEAELFSPKHMLDLDMIKETDLDTYKHLYESIKAGKKHDPVEIRMRLGRTWGWKRIYLWEAYSGDTIGFIEDFNQWWEEMEHIRQKAGRDALTGLYNRRGFEQAVNAHMQDRRIPGAKVAFMCLDLDHFKEVNDQLGHPAGDRVLFEAAAVMNTVIRSEDLACRMGGDEFVLFFADIKDAEAARTIGEKLTEVLEKTYEKDGVRVTVSASIGIVVTDKGASLEKLYETADKALYEVKKAQRNGYKIVEE